MWSIELKSVIYWMKLLSGVLQIGGLLIASRIDLKTKAVEIAADEIPDDEAVNAYNAVKSGVPYIPSKEAQRHAALESHNDSKKNALLFRWSIGMVGAGMLLQLVADIMEPPEA